MLEVQNLCRNFRSIPAIANVSFTVAPGEIVGFLGPNGAGKSTTVKIITGLLRPNDGRVLFEGHDTRKDMETFGVRSVTFPKKPISITTCPASNTFSLSADCVDSAKRSLR